ncbi:MAG: biliverdin-producing heme oxygenase [Burkholderiaceae bacterium]
MLVMREATRDIHDGFETGLKVARPEAGRDDYLHFISAMYGWLSPFETRLWQAEWPLALAPQARGQKSAWLECDLRAAGMDDAAIAALPLAPDALLLDTPARRFGVAYVMEGAQLGSQLLARTLKPKLAPWPARWLSGYGENASTYWLSFRKEAELALNDAQSQAEAGAAAAAAFRSLADWFQARDAA